MPRNKEFDEEEVLKKAMILFWKKGYYDTSIKDLIAFLGISNASIYNTFGGKKELFNRSFEYYRNSNFEGMSNFIRSQKDVRKGLVSVFEKIIFDDNHDEDCKGCFIVNTTTELLPIDSEIQKVIDAHQIIDAHRKKVEEVFYNFLLFGVEDGQISEMKDIKMISRLLYTMMTGLRVLGKVKPDPQESMASVEAVLSLLD